MTLAVQILVWAAVVLTLLSAWLMLRMRDSYQMLHFMSPPASVAALLLTLAIFLQDGARSEAFKALFTTGVLILMNALVTHATARAFRIRMVRDRFRPSKGDEVPRLASDVPVPSESGG